MSDDLRFLRNHQVVLDAEDRAIRQFDAVSVPSRLMFESFPGLSNLYLHPHGLRAELFQHSWPNPFAADSTVNVVFVGNSYFDCDFLARASQLFPNWTFHIVGGIANLPQRENILAYGEIPFESTIPFLQHADIGLQTRSYILGMETLTDSLKVRQYTYCRLPIVAPDFIESEQSHFFPYHPGDSNSIQEALEKARAFDRSTITTEGLQSWDEMVQQMLADAE